MGPSMNSEKPSVIIGDDHPLIVQGVRSVIERDYEVAAVASDGNDLVLRALGNRRSS